MRAHAGAGRPAQAVAHYGAFAAHLESALGAAPEDATEELCERLRHGEPLDDAAPRAELAVPARPNAFFGREAELSWLAGRFSEPDVRWITLVGPGGVGKTRLALEAARRLGARFRDGACFVPLSGLKSPDELPAAVATALGIQLGNVAPTRVIAEWLRARELLLILDELEGLHGAVPTLRAWLDRAPNLRILATSQERVGLYAEHTLPVVGLDAPSPTDAWETPALRLWAARVRQHDPFRPMDDAEAAGAAAIVRLVDGLPLAIELAAESPTPARETAARLAEDLSGLLTGLRDVRPQHRSLELLMAATWARLDPDLAQALERLSVFTGRFDGAAAKGVADADPTTLLRLADRSLLRADAGRWRVHAVLRWSARARAGGRWAVTDRRHAEWHASLLSAAGEGLRLQADRAARDTLVAGWEDVRTAWRYAVAHRDASLLARMADALASLAAWVGWASEGRRLLDDAIDVLPFESPQRARLQMHQGLLCWRAAAADDAVAHLEAALASPAASSDASLEVRALAQLGAIRRNQGRQAEALVHLEAAVARAPAAPPLDRAEAEYRLAVARYEREELAEARALLERVIRGFEATGSPAHAAHAAAVLGLCRVRLGDAGGVAVAQEAHRSTRRNGWFGLGDTANCLAIALLTLGRWGEAERAARTAETAYTEIGFTPGRVTAHMMQALASAGRGELDAARRHARTTAELALTLGTERPAAEALVALAAVDAREGRTRAARIAGRLAAEPTPPSADGARLLGAFIQAPAAACTTDLHSYLLEILEQD